MDALTLLREDHQKLKELFGQLEETEDPKQRKQLFDEIMSEMTVHERIEEDIFYPAVEKRAKEKELKELVIESYLEHGFVDRVADEINKTKPDDETWAPKAKIMKEQIEHHAFDEEEGELFPKVRELFDASELEDLGTQMSDLKEEVKTEIETARPSASPS